MTRETFLIGSQVVSIPKPERIQLKNLQFNENYTVLTRSGKIWKFKFLGGKNILLLPELVGSVLVPRDRIFKY